MVVTTVALAAGAALAQDEGMDGAALEDAEGPVRKPPRVWYRPSAATPGEQLALVRDLEARGRLAVAGRRCEALVRTWPDSPEAVVALFRALE